MRVCRLTTNFLLYCVQALFTIENKMHNLAFNARSAIGEGEAFLVTQNEMLSCFLLDRQPFSACSNWFDI